MKCGLYAALFAALFIALLGGSSASAASVYDNAYQTTDNLTVHAEWYTNKNNIDIGVNWSGLITGDWSGFEHNGGDYIQSYRGTTNPASQSQIDQYIQDWSNATNWIVSSHCHSNDDYCDIHIYFTTHQDGLSLQWHENRVDVQGTSIQRVYINGNLGGSQSDRQIQVRLGYTGAPGNSISSPTVGVYNYLAFVNNPNYPIDYEGDQVREGLDLKDTISPDFTYSVIDKDITAADHKNDLPEFVPDEGYQFDGYEIQWSLFTIHGDIVDHQNLQHEKEYKFKVDEYGSYRLDARYSVRQCSIETPDDCSYVDLATEFQDLDFTRTAVMLEIDGSSISGNTGLMDCDVNGFCQLPENTPAALFFNGLDNMNTHGLTQFFTAPITFLATLPAKADNCTPISFPLMGETIEIECLKPRYYTWSTTIMNIYTTLLIAGTGYLIAFNVFRTIKDINTPDKDKIEVARL